MRVRIELVFPVMIGSNLYWHGISRYRVIGMTHVGGYANQLNGLIPGSSQ
jgi:hypothetical protein